MYYQLFDIKNEGGKMNNESSTNKSYLFLKNLIISTPLIIGIIILFILLIHIFGWIEISQSLSLIIEYGPIFTLLATLMLVTITAHYSFSTKKMADSTEKNVKIAKKTTETMNQAMWHQVLQDIKKDYRSPEMMSAIDALWDFYKDCQSKKLDYKKEYKIRYKDEKNKISNNKMNIQDGLNYKRRLLTHFYIHLASIYKNGMLPPKMIFDWWGPSDFQMFDKFLIPLQKEMSKMLGTPIKETEIAIEPLNELKTACDLYYKENKFKNEGKNDKKVY